MLTLLFFLRKACLVRNAAQVLRELRAGDSLGNTGLIHDSWWEYSAVATEDSWTLTITREELADLLRGRPELSHSVLQGVYETFTRRLRQAAAEDGQVSADWLLAADLDKSPMLKRQLSSKRADWKGTIAAVPRQDL
uniref:Cyclic nucleotide-binding domain-containing protein n=1 Tax=Chrysotila carterae TaxID=13221 RepID=A0A7S4BAU2_CHRCT